jgi:hypothetical protein
MLVVDGGADCIFIRSVVVFVDLNNYAEVGMTIDESGLAEECPISNSPQLLVYAIQGGSIKCDATTPDLTVGHYERVRVENPDHNNRMYYRGSAYQGFYTVSFNQGGIRSFTERHDGNDSLQSDMNGLDYMGSADNWNSWPNQTHSSTGTVTGWTFCEDSNIRYRVVSTSC